MAVCVPAISLGGFYHYWSVNRTTNEIKEESKGSLQHVKDRMERLLEQLEKDSLQLALDPTIVNVMTAPNYRSLLEEQKLINQTLSRTRFSSDLFEDVFFYREGDEFALSAEIGFSELQYFAPAANMHKMLESNKNVYWKYFQGSQGNSQSGSYFFMRRLPSSTGNLYNGIIMLVIKEKLVSTYLEDYFSLSGEKNIYVFNEKQEVVFRSMNTAKPYPAELDPEIRKVIDNEIGTGDFFADDKNGHNMLYTFSKTAYGRTYISMIPKENITRQVYGLQLLSVSTLLLLICFGISLVTFFIQRAYNPISQLMSYGSKLSGGRMHSGHTDEVGFIRDCLDHLKLQSETVSSYMSKMQPSLRERFLQQLLEGNYNNKHLLREDCDAYNITINHHYAVLVVQVENVTVENRFQPDDGPIISFAITNVMEELQSQNSELQGYIVRSSNGNGIAILSFGDDHTEQWMEQQARSYAEAVYESLRKYLTFKVSIGIGRIYSHIADIVVSCNEAKAALQYRLYKDTEPVLYIEDLEALKKQTRLYYPRTIDQEIIKNLIEGELEQAATALRQFSNVVRESESRSFIFQSYHMLLSSIISAMEVQQISISEIMEHDLLGELQRCQTAKDIDYLFSQKVFPLVLKLLSTYQTDVGKQIIKQICQHIHEHIESDISLVRCAELVKMSPSYISRLFKKELGINFQEYVMENKVKRTQQMLARTDMSLGEIAVAIGYSERNLIRIFQRFTGTTPGQYRIKLK